MDNLLEILIPLVLAILYFVGGNFFGGKKDEEEDGPPREQERPQTQPAPSREQEIQEEIRRRIQERRAQREGGAGAAPQEVARQQEPDPVEHSYNPNQPETPTRRETAPQQRRVEPVFRRMEPEVVEPQESAFEREARERQRQIEETRRRAEEMRARLAKQGTAPAPVEALAPASSAYSINREGFGIRQRAAGEGTFRDEVLTMLSDPLSTRKAILLQEILGSPVGLRKDGKQGPLWEQ